MYRVPSRRAVNGRLQVGNRRPKQEARRLRVSNRRPKRESCPRKPYRQGDLDGLCGLYSTVNAFRALCPELDDEAVSVLFATLIGHLPKVGADPALVVTGGVGRGELQRLIIKARTYMLEELDIALKVTRLPKGLRRDGDLDMVWGTLAKRLSPTCVAILGLGGRHSHWTVATGATRQQIRLYDSSRMGVLKRRRCTVGRASKRTSISPVHVWLIERQEG